MVVGGAGRTEIDTETFVFVFAAVVVVFGEGNAMRESGDLLTPILRLLRRVRRGEIFAGVRGTGGIKGLGASGRWKISNCKSDGEIAGFS